MSPPEQEHHISRVSTLLRLTPEKNAIADALIRRYRYVQIDAVKDELQELGISISRSALGRHMKKLGERDGFLMGSTDVTVITIMERSTGQVTVFKTPARLEALLAHIHALLPPDPVS